MKRAFLRKRIWRRTSASTEITGQPAPDRTAAPVYAPTRKEVDHALEVIAAAEEAESRGLGVVSLNGKMIDGPIIDHARKVVALSASGIRD